MQSFLQFLIIGLGAGATYALFAQGAVLIYRGSGLVNFAQGAIGTFAAYIAFVDLKDKHDWSTLPAAVVGVVAAGLVCTALPGGGAARAAPGRGHRAGHRDHRTARPPAGDRGEALRRGQPTRRLLPPARRVALGEHHRAGGADLSRRHHAGRDLRAVGMDAVHTRRTRHQRERPERTRGADARMVTRPPFRAHVDARRLPRRTRRRARGSAHRPVGAHVHRRGDRGRASVPRCSADSTPSR